MHGRFASLMCTLVLGVFGVTAVWSEVPQPSLLWWQFDEESGAVAADASGNGRDGVINGAVRKRGGVGGTGGCLEFLGTGQTVEDVTAPNYMNGLEALTVALWIKSDAVGTDSGFIWFSVPNGIDTGGMRYDAASWSWKGGTNLIKVYILGVGGLESSDAKQTTEWQHVALVWASNQEIALYINGLRDKPRGVDPPAAGPISGVTTLLVGKGAKDNAKNKSWDGMIDDVRVYDYALTAEQIHELGTTNVAAFLKAINPQPAHGAIAVQNPLFQWTAGDTGIFHNVYLGTTPELGDADLVLLCGVMTTYYHPQGLEPGTTYYWRVDEVEVDMTTVHTGDVWSFTTMPPTADIIVDAVLTAPKQTRGEGDQFPWTQLANGDHMTVVNDGRGPHTVISNNTSRVNTDIWADFGPTYNHKPWRVTDMDLGDLNNPQWNTSEIGYDQDGPPEKVNGSGVSAFYAFGCLAVGDNGLIIALALAGSRHNNSTYTDAGNPITKWGGNAFIASSDGGGTWWTRTGKRLAQVNWGAAMPPDDCTLIPANVSGLSDDAFTLGTFLQMGPGYQANTDGYVYLYAPSALQNDRDNTSQMKQRRTVVARCFIETDHSNHTAVWNPANWKVWDGSDWSPDFSQAQHVMEWPGPGARDGQAWYPSVVYLPSESVYIAISSEKDMANYPAVHSGIHVMQAPKPEGPWTLVKSFPDIDLQGDSEDRIFSPYWIPGWCGRDAGTDDHGRRLVDCYYSTSSIGNVEQNGWDRDEKKRYGVNVGKLRFSLSATRP